jgi:uncharacterized protein (DUF2141 family)
VLALGLGLLLSSSPAADPERGSLTVTATGLRAQDGDVLVMIFDDVGSWLNPERALRVAHAARTGARATVTFEDLPRGEYAVSVIHDENRSGAMDMRWFPYPRPAEGAGASNDPTATFGPPTYNDARFQLAAPNLELIVTVRYAG